MAHPVVEGVAESSVNTAGTSHTVTLPASIVSTDLVLIIMDIGSTSATLNALTDWSEVLDEAVANGLKIIRYTGAGVPGNPTFTSSAATRSASIAYRISGVDKTVTPQIGTTATGTSTTPNPPSVTPTGGVSKDYLFIAFFGQAGEEADDDTWANTPPTNYTPSPPRQKACGTVGTNLGGLIASAERQLTTGSAENPGTFSVDVSAAWRAQTIIVHPPPPQNYTVDPADNLGLTDLVDLLVTKVIDLSPDTVGLTDVADPQKTAGGDSETVTPTDNLGLTDARVFDQGKTHADNLGLTDARVFDQGKTRTDNLGLTDTPALSHGRARTDNLGLTDDTEVVLDITIEASADALGLTDSITTQTSKAVTGADTEGLTDTVASTGVFVRSVTDNLGLTDNVTTDVGKLTNVTDNLGLTDTRVYDQGKARTDNLGLSDAVTFTLAKVYVDDLGLTDTVALVAVYARTVTDNVGLTDIAGSDAGLVYRLVVTSAAGPRYTATPGSSRFASTAGRPKFVTED